MKLKHLLSILLAVLLLAVPKSAEAQTYIKEIVVASGKSGVPQRELESRGYTIDNHDLNKGCWFSDYVYLGWKTTTDPKEAITNIVVRTGEGEKDEFTFSDGRKYFKAETICGSSDLNKDAGGDYLYLYYTKANPEQGIVTSVDFRGSNANMTNSIALVEGTNIKGEAANFNRGTGGDNIYYSITKTVIVGQTMPKLEREFKAEALGGGLYKVTIPEGCINDQDTCILANRNLVGNIYFVEKKNNVSNKVHIAKITHTNNDKDGFDKSWGCGYMPVVNEHVSSVTRPSENGRFDVIQSDRFGYMSSEGNDVDLRLITLYFQLQDDTTIDYFRYEGDGTTNYSGNNNFRIETNIPINQPEAPEGMNTVTVIDPVMDFNAEKPGSGSLAGSQVLNVVPTGKMTWAGVWDTEKRELVFAGNIDERINQWTYSFPPQKKTKYYTLILNGENRQMTDKGMSSNPGWFAIPFTVKPFHSIESVTITLDKQIDEKGVFKQENKIQWVVDNVQQEDAFDTDFYIVQRAQSPDFSDAVTVGTLPVSYADADSTELKVERVSDFEDVGTYTVVDDLEGNDFNSENPSDGGKLYYRVVRAVYGANWGYNTSGGFSKADSVRLDNFLAGVESLKVEKTKDFDMESTVKVRVELTGGKTEFAKGESPKELFDKLGTGTDADSYFNALKSSTIWDEKASIVVQRYSPAEDHDNGKDLVEKKIVINGDEVKWDDKKKMYYAEIEDIQTYPYTHYYYKASVDGTRSSYCLLENPVVATTEAEADSCYKTTLTPVAHLTASKGTVKGRVVVEWDAEDGVYNGFKVERRLAAIETRTGDGKKVVSKTDNNPYEVVGRRDTLATSYVDDRAEAGRLYEYRISAQLKVRQQVLEASRIVYGWNPYFGTVKGRVTLNNNAPMPDKVTVSIMADETVAIDQIHDADNDTIIIPGYSEVYEKSLYTTDGTFEFDSIPYQSGGTLYTVDVKSESGTRFVLEGQEDNTAARFSLNDGKHEYSTIHYICNETRQFSGRVLYTNSTIPVRDCQFEMNGNPVLDAHGKPIVTDSKGEFSFLLPYCKMTLKAVKDGHTFVDDGYILARASDKREGEEYAFVPSADYDGLILTDSTTVRLVGRLIGGNRQGRLPLGMGLTKNNLGDNMRLVLELDGDNTSRITYFKDNPDLSSYSKSFTQAVNIDNLHEQQLDSTNVTFEKKRIVIEPDVKTGEFCVDLAPTKYKVTEMSATGYSTLFNEGEGFQVLDLSPCDTCLVTDTYTCLNEDKHGDETRTTTYNARYNRIVHNPVSVTYEQYRYGMKQNFFGAEKMTIYNIAGEKKTAKVATYDKEKKEVSYMFQYPIFESGDGYELHVYAHEDYYYNGDTINAPDMVYLEGDTLLVNNGLAGAVDTEVYPLDKNGHATVAFRAANPEYSLNRKDALRYLYMQVNSNGYYYNVKPLEAFVTGVRDKGHDVMPLASFDGPINVVDVIRDPYGSRSYSYREKGTNYHWDYSVNLDLGISVDINVKMGTKGSYFTGAFTGLGAGAVAGTSSNSSNNFTLDIVVPIVDAHYSSSGSYDKTLNDRISTSADPLDVGAMADVYCGFMDTYNLWRVETFSVIDSTTYRLVKPAIESGAIRIIQEGEGGNYLAVSEKVQLGKGKQREFVYSQKHILGTIIPQLVQKLEAELLTGDSIEIQKLANAGKKQLYWLKSGGDEKDTTTCIVPIYPCVEGSTERLANYTTPEVNPETIIETIRQWLSVIATNEQKKLNAISQSGLHDSYSLSSASRIEHSESASAYYKEPKWTFSLGGVDLRSGSWKSNIGAKLSTSVANLLHKKLGLGALDNSATGQQTKDMYGNDRQNPITQVVELPGFMFKFDFLPDPKVNFNRNKSKKCIRSAGSGYVLETVSNSYLDMDVYRCDDYKLDEQFISMNKASGSTLSDEEFVNDFWDTVSDNPNSKDVSEAKLHDFVFTVRGGAERGPWYKPDSTICYIDSVSMKGYPLTARTLKIDNPKISISNPVASNIPVGDKAIFSVRLTNESEVTTNMNKDLMNPSLFKLFLDDKSCPDGLAITMDGMPLTDGRTFQLKPGESITKTIQVERAGKQYRYENVRLGFRDEASSLIDFAAISLNYLPASTPVKLALPVDKWVLNTLSAKDEQDRYYLPLEVNGFNVSYDNFDHIELQYKKKTDGDTKWVNMCSFYANDSLFNAASGTKEKLTSGTIKYRFYGDADPVEMGYDLRAVSFCRLGAGYVTAVSDVKSGMKDTRNPEIFGKPKPTNGVLTFEDVISFPFNEPIAYNYLDKTANFQITGITNDLSKKYDTALSFPGNESVAAGSDYSLSDVPKSKVNRSLAGQDFTWEAMVQLDKTCDIATLFTISDDGESAERYFTLTYNSGRLEASMDGISFMSKSIDDPKYKGSGLSLKDKLTNVAVTFTNDSVGIKNQMRFYVDGTELDMDKVTRLNSSVNEENHEYAPVELEDDYHITSNTYGKILLGCYMKGIMADARLWDKAMSSAEMASKRTKVLSKSEPSLMCYWPMDEMMGNVLHDKVNGTDLHFSRQTWMMPTGQHSLKLRGEGIDLKTRDTDFMRAEYNDFTLSFWTQIDSELTKGDSVTIFNAGSKLDKQHFAIYMNNEDVIVQSGEFRQSIVSKSELADNKWHLVTAVTNKSHNSSSVYIDGKMVMTADADAFCGMPSAVKIGDDNFYGGFDHIAFWHLAIPGNSLTTVSNATPLGKEMGLEFYMPFEMDHVNSQNTHEYVFSPYNMVVRKDEAGNELTTYDCVLPESMLTEEKLKEIDNTTSYPPARSFGIIQNIPFTWTATNNELQINLNKRDAEINHQYVNVTVRDVEDLAGNTLVNPQMMLVYVDRNVLYWDDPKVNINVKYGTKEKLTPKLINKSGRNIYYSLENNCTWLSMSKENGVSMPLSYDNIEMEISDGLAPGEYFTTVYAVDEDNLSSPLAISVKVEADEPDWKVTDNMGYNYTMNIMGRVKLKNEGGHEFYDTDKRDIVAAFYDGVCLGKANITVDNANNPMVNLTVMGNDKMVQDKEKGLTFLLWDASTNVTRVIVPNTAGNKITFVNGSLVGSPKQPVIFTPTNEEKQVWNLETGWNWVSLYIKPGNNISINQLFDTNNGFSAGDVIMVNGHASELIVYTKKDGTKGKYWNTGINTIHGDDKHTYQIYVHQPVQATVYGYEYEEDERYITLNAAPANGAVWCHLPYLLSVDQPINVAMSGFDLQKNAKEGTVIKNRKLFAVMDADGKWKGSLDYMHPGEGYFIKYFGNEDLQVKFTNTQKTTYAKTVRFDDDDLDGEQNYLDTSAEIVSEARTMMPVIADIDDMDSFEEGDEIVAFAKGNAIGSAKVIEVASGKRLFFISLNAEDGNTVRFAHIRGGEVIGKSSNGIIYDSNAVTGTLDVPYTIDFSNTANDNTDVYSISGVKYRKAEDVKNRKGVFIIGDSKIVK